MAAAHAEATTILGQAEAEAMATLAVAYSEDPAFYKFIRALDSYDSIIDSEHHVDASRRQRAVQVSPRQRDPGAVAGIASRIDARKALPNRSHRARASSTRPSTTLRERRVRIVTSLLGFLPCSRDLRAGCTIVKKEERAVLTRFGKVVDAEVGARHPLCVFRSSNGPTCAK